MKIIEEKNNEILNRKELKFIVEAEKSPSIAEAGEIVARHFKASGELVIIKKVQGKFGRNTFLISAFIYKSKEDKESTEPKKAGKKEQKIEEKAKSEEKKEKQEAKE